MDTIWFAVDDQGNVARLDTGEPGPFPDRDSTVPWDEIDRVVNQTLLTDILDYPAAERVRRERLYSYDFDYLFAYARENKPRVPLKAEQLPTRIREALPRVAGDFEHEAVVVPGMNWVWWSVDGLEDLLTLVEDFAYEDDSDVLEAFARLLREDDNSFDTWVGAALPFIVAPEQRKQDVVGPVIYERIADPNYGPHHIRELTHLALYLWKGELPDDLVALIERTPRPRGFELGPLLSGARYRAIDELAKRTDEAADVLWAHIDPGDPQPTFLARVGDHFALFVRIGAEYQWLEGDRDHVLAHVPDRFFHEATAAIDAPPRPTTIPAVAPEPVEEEQEQEEEAPAVFPIHRSAELPTQPMAKTTPGLTVNLSMVPRISWAGQHNELGVVQQLRLHNESEEPLDGLIVRVWVEDLTLTAGTGLVRWLPSGGSHVLDDLHIRLSGPALMGTLRRTPGTLWVEVANQDGVVHCAAHPIDVLAWDQWTGTEVMPDLLAAFCRPRHPTVRQIAGEPLSYDHADPSLVEERLRRLHGTVSSFQLTARALPVSAVQRVRAPDDLLEEKVATGLDTALWMAGALEFAGLHPVVGVVGASALVGVWLVDYHLPFSVLDDPEPLARRVEAGELVLVDALPGLPWDVAVEHGQKVLADPDHFGFVVDVLAAREAGIAALPFPSEDEDVELPTEAPETKSKRLERWKTRLLDLSMRNRLLNCRDSKRTLPLLMANVGHFEDHLAGGTVFGFEGRSTVKVEHDVADITRSCPWCDATVTGPRVKCPNCGGPLEAPEDGDPLEGLLTERFQAKTLIVDLADRELDKRLRTLFRTARAQLQETGANTLYVTLGVLRYYEHRTSTTARSAPLVLIPVRIDRKSVRGGYSLVRTDEETVVNPTLLQYLHDVHGFDSLPLADLPEDDSGYDIPLILRRFRKLVEHEERWAVVDIAQVTQLSFTRYMMWRDLERRSSDLLHNMAVRQLLTDDDTDWPEVAELPSPETLDATHDVADVICPLDADSSQLSAIFAADAGNSFVLQGPPGTGKSQTITNLIAHGLANGRTVLFVSEKMAALDVVHSRLKRVGLAPFCLELHSNKSRKADVIRQMQEAFDAARKRSKHDWRAHAEELQKLRDQLNTYVDELHADGVFGYSAYDATANLIELADLPLFDLDLGGPEALDAEQFDALESASSTLELLVDEVGAPGDNAWRMVRWRSWQPDKLARLRTGIKALDSAAAGVQALLPGTKELFGLGEVSYDLERLDVLEEISGLLLTCPAPTTSLVSGSGWPHRREAIGEWVEHGRHRTALWDGLSARWKPGLLGTELGPLHQKFVAWAEAFFLFAFLFLFFSRRKLAEFAVDSVGANVDVRDDLKVAQEVVDEDVWLGGFDDDARSVLGPFWKGPTSDFERIADVTAWSDRFRRLLGQMVEWDSPEVRAKLVDQVTETPERFEADGPVGRKLADLAAAIRTLRERREAIRDLLDVDEALAWSGPDHCAEVRACVAGWKGDEAGLRDWCMWYDAATELRDRGLGDVVDAHLAGDVAADVVEDVTRKAVLTWWLDARTGASDVLRSFHGLDHERKIERFRELDNASRTLALKEVRSRLAANVPTLGASTHGEMGVLNRELRKKRSHMPLRKLFQAIPHVLQRIKPCVLMSPLSVAQYLDPSLALFDMVVFDEASQIPPWEAIGAMARGKQVVVVGDSKQLPPTSFFQRGDDDSNPDEEARQDLESILDECVAIGMPALTLDWHYRSQHEDLIAFSNRHYYADRLHTFPCARAKSAELGVKWCFVADGVYDKGRARTNRKEAEALVADVVARLRDPNNTRSVGIVTFSMPQQSLIEDLLDEARRRNPSIEKWFHDTVPEPVFVKNLENVQGDERDIIFFSICYGPDRTDQVSMNFGPLNRQGGERRLNVAITRARTLLTVYASITADRIDLARTGAEGVKHLRTFLRYCERGVQAIGDAAQLEVMDVAKVPDVVRHRLEEEGYTVDPLVGCSAFRMELAVQHPEQPDRYLLGVETDGDLYAASPSARDRDRLRSEVLGRLGWRLHRVWATEWHQNADRAWKRLLDELEEAKNAPEPEPEPVIEVVEEEDFGFEEEEKEPTVEHPLYVLTDPDDLLFGDPENETFYDRRVESEVIEAIQVVLGVEAPVHVGEVARRVAACWGLTRITKKPKDHVRKLALRLDPPPQLRGDFLWRADQDPDTWDVIRVPGHARSADVIPDEEIAVACAVALRRVVASTRDDLARDAAKQFGITRLGKKVRAAMDRGVAVLVERGMCTVDGEQILLKR